MNTALRWVINFAITATLILLFANIGWLEIESPPQFTGIEFIDNLLIAGIIGLFMIVIDAISDVLYKVFKIATLGIGRIIYPIYFIVVGYLKIFLPSLILENWYSVNTFNVFVVLIMAMLIGLVRIPRGKK